MKLTPRKIEGIGSLANALKDLFVACRDQATVLRSQERRKPRLYGNPDIIFKDEAWDASEEIIGAIEDVKYAAELCGVTLDLAIADEDVDEFIEFCKTRQLKDSGRWDAELTQEERGYEYY